jgi:hypothetical protein
MDPDPPQEPEKPPDVRPPRRGLLPPIANTADFIVFIFACTVAFILVALTVGVIIAAFNGGDIKSYFAVITSIVTSVISALVGYLAGRSGRPPEPPPVL